jgi:hypothetical protein
LGLWHNGSYSGCNWINLYLCCTIFLWQNFWDCRKTQLRGRAAPDADVSTSAAARYIGGIVKGPHPLGPAATKLAFLVTPIFWYKRNKSWFLHPKSGLDNVYKGTKRWCQVKTGLPIDIFSFLTIFDNLANFYYFEAIHYCCNSYRCEKLWKHPGPYFYLTGCYFPLFKDG